MYTIKEVGKLMHVSEHTIRFWAKNGFFPFIKRSDKNVRLFDDEDLEWVKLVKCLRSAGVNHNEIKNYIKMCLEINVRAIPLSLDEGSSGLNVIM